MFSSNFMTSGLTFKSLINVEFTFVYGIRIQFHSFAWSSTDYPALKRKTRELQKNIYFCYTDYEKAFDCVDHN